MQFVNVIWGTKGGRPAPPEPSCIREVGKRGKRGKLSKLFLRQLPSTPLLVLLRSLPGETSVQALSGPGACWSWSRSRLSCPDVRGRCVYVGVTDRPISPSGTAPHSKRFCHYSVVPPVPVKSSCLSGSRVQNIFDRVG